MYRFVARMKSRFAPKAFNLGGGKPRAYAPLPGPNMDYIANLGLLAA